MMLLSFCEVIREGRKITIIGSEAIGDRLRLRTDAIAEIYLADRVEIWHEDFCVFVHDDRFSTDKMTA